VKILNFIRYTCNECVPIEPFYVDDTNNGSETHFQFSANKIKAYIGGAEKIDTKISHLPSSSFTSVALNMLPKDQWVNYAIHKYLHTFHGSKTCVFGSMEPWVEAASLYAGAEEVVTIEYNLLTYNHSKIRTVSSSGFQALFSQEATSFDIALSVSSFDHDGLGRYGDPLDPDGDLKAMKKVYSLLKPGGLLFLTVPVGPDVVVFNLHRRYGAARLPLLLNLVNPLFEPSLYANCSCLDPLESSIEVCNGDNAVCNASIPHVLEKWELVEVLGWNEQRLVTQVSWRQSYEPIFVLKKPVIVNLS